MLFAEGLEVTDGLGASVLVSALPSYALEMGNGIAQAYCEFDGAAPPALSECGSPPTERLTGTFATVCVVVFAPVGGCSRSSSGETMTRQPVSYTHLTLPTKA